MLLPFGVINDDDRSGDDTGEMRRLLLYNKIHVTCSAVV